MRAQTRSKIRALLERHGLRPRQRLGQHFLADANITKRIVATAGVSRGDQVVEIGAGTGTLTTTLAESGATVVTYEVDRRLRPLLEEVVLGLDVEVRFADAMSVDLELALGPGDWVLVANLPYNVGTPLLLRALRTAPRIVRFVVMVQEEVARRLVAGPGGKDYGLPSVVAQVHSQPRIAFSVPPQVFLPAPRVGSAVVVMDRVTASSRSERAIELAAAAFSKRRKMLRRSLAGALADPEQALTAAGIDPTRRAEELSPADYLRLAGVAG